MSILRYCPGLLLCALISALGRLEAADGLTTLARAHAHNDYLHERPLFDALDQRFGSVEADVYLVGSELLVAHTRLELRSERTLRALYLDPLRQRIQRHGGSVHGDDQSFTLLIDIKSNGVATFAALNQLLADYPDVFARIENDALVPAPVVAIVSGDRAVAEIMATSPRFAAIDGRLSDLDTRLSSISMPLISDNWQSHFKWRGEGEFSADERQKLADIVKRAHADKRRVRLWATPDRPEVCKVLRDEGVDLINTDDLAGLSRFLRD